MKITTLRLVVILVVLLAGCSGGDSSMDPIITKVSSGDEATLQSIHWGREQLSSEALAVGVRGMRAFAIPDEDHSIEVAKKFGRGDYTLFVLRTSWEIPGNPTRALPLLVKGEGEQAKVVGLMLPFNDVLMKLPPEDESDWEALSTEWISWISSAR